MKVQKVLSVFLTLIMIFTVVCFLIISQKPKEFSRMLSFDEENGEVILFGEKYTLNKGFINAATKLFEKNAQINRMIIPSPIIEIAQAIFDSVGSIIKSTANNVKAILHDIVYGAM